MKIGIFINNYGTSNVVLPDLKTGNPGIGGSQYEMFLLYQCYLEYQKASSGLEFVLFTTHEQKALFDIATIIVPNVDEALSFCEKAGDFDYVILRANDGIKVLDTLKNTKVIYWMHNFINYESATAIAKSSIVQRVVFVSQEEYDFYYDHDIIYKSTCIFNAIPNFEVRDYPPIKKENNVVFIGDISPYKMLDRLTAMWPSIVKKCPDARLMVLGNGDLYGKNKKFGKYMIAEEEYERKVLAPLIKHNVLSTVSFLGLVGADKPKIIAKAKVGVLINPGETFCIAATDIVTAGVPVIAPKSTGYCDVISNGKTGFLCPSRRTIKLTTIRILKKEHSHEIKAKSFDYLKQFSVETFWNNWSRLLDDLSSPNKMPRPRHKNNLGVNWKWLGVTLHLIRKTLRLPNGFSRIGIRHYINVILRR